MPRNKVITNNIHKLELLEERKKLKESGGFVNLSVLTDWPKENLQLKFQKKIDYTRNLNDGKLGNKMLN